MPRKDKFEQAQPSPSPSAPAANKYGRWRTSVHELLRSRWQRSALDVESIAATVVGMFDSGATDAEIANFLLSQELLDKEAPGLTDAARMELVRELHRSAGSNVSTRPSDEKL